VAFIRRPASGWKLAGAHAQLFGISDLVPADGRTAALSALTLSPAHLVILRGSEIAKEPQVVVLRRRG
jgi:hypothetical protein